MPKVKKVQKRSSWKSFWAVFAGFVTVALLSSITDGILESIGVFPPAARLEDYTDSMYVTALLYRIVYTILGGYITAKLAPQNAMKHVKILAILGTIGGVIGIFVGWNLAPHWYCIAIAVTAYPTVWLGGKLHSK